MNFNKLDWQEIWCETFEWNKWNPKDRKFNDSIEHQFWIELAPCYAQKYNLNDDTNLIRKKLSEIIGENKKILEIGCGTGNFTLLMAQYSEKVLAIDFSPAMLHELKIRLSENRLKNVTLHQCKWEEYNVKEQYDFIVSVNSLYRIHDMERTLLKINDSCRQGFVIVRTIQRPFLFKMYKDVGIDLGECNDYQLMALMLWKNGIRANLEYITYEKSKEYNNIDDILKEMKVELGEKVFAINREKLLENLTSQLIGANGKYILKQPRITALIYLDKVDV